jgi:transposase-like protein
MVRWLKVLETPPPPPRRVYKKQVIVNGPRLPATRSRAFFAFWSMHVEAHRLSGLNAARYAEAHRLSVIKFRRLRRRFELNPLAQNWHDLYHPVALDSSQAETNLRQQLRPTVVKRAAVEAPAAPLPTLSSLQRRQYTTARKLAIVAETTEAGVTASMVARRHGVTPSMIVRWRNQFGMTPKEHPLLITARVVATPARGRPKPTLPLVLQNLLPAPPGAIAVELPDGRRVFAPAGSDPESVRQYIANRESTS